MYEKSFVAGLCTALVIAFLFSLVMGLSWIITCGGIKLITMCFGWSFKWSIATGIWLIMLLAGTVFKSTTTVKK